MTDDKGATYSREQFMKWGAQGGSKSNTYLWRSLIDPNMVGTAMSIARRHRCRGWDPKARVKLDIKRLEQVDPLPE